MHYRARQEEELLAQQFPGYREYHKPRWGCSSPAGKQAKPMVAEKPVSVSRDSSRFCRYSVATLVVALPLALIHWGSPDLVARV
jgi:hypothetical protein